MTVCDERRSLFDVEFRRSHLWVARVRSAQKLNWYNVKKAMSISG